MRVPPSTPLSPPVRVVPRGVTVIALEGRDGVVTPNYPKKDLFCIPCCVYMYIYMDMAVWGWHIAYGHSVYGRKM